MRGPFEPTYGHRFHLNKAVLDPYAKAIGRDARWEATLFPDKIGNPAQDLSFDDRALSFEVQVRACSGNASRRSLARRP